MHALKGAVPRAFRDHRTRAGRTYGHYVRAFAKRFGGTVPAHVRPTLLEAGRAVVELGRLGDDLERAVARNRRRDASRLRRQQFALREQLVRLERRLEELACRGQGAPRPTGPVDVDELEPVEPRRQRRGAES